MPIIRLVVVIAALYLVAGPAAASADGPTPAGPPAEAQASAPSSVPRGEFPDAGDFEHSLDARVGGVARNGETPRGRVATGGPALRLDAVVNAAFADTGYGRIRVAAHALAALDSPDAESRRRVGDPAAEAVGTGLAVGFGVRVESARALVEPFAGFAYRFQQREIWARDIPGDAHRERYDVFSGQVGVETRVRVGESARVRAIAALDLPVAMDETIRIHDTGESADVRLGNRPGLLLEVGLTLAPPDEANWPVWLGLVWSATRFGNGDVAPCSTGAASCWQPRREDLVGVMVRIGS